MAIAHRLPGGPVVHRFDAFLIWQKLSDRCRNQASEKNRSPTVIVRGQHRSHRIENGGHAGLTPNSTGSLMQTDAQVNGQPRSL